MNPQPNRNLSASFDERTRASHVEFAHWRETHPNFTTPELLENWRRIRTAWNQIGRAHV